MTHKDGDNTVDVLVVGAGPAGAACATVLASAGRSVLLCDRAIFPRDKICGDTLNPRCWPAFARLGVSERVRETANGPISGVRVVNRRGDTVAAEAPDRFFALSRRELDQIVVDAAVQAGATFRDGLSLAGVDRQGCWRIRLRDHRTGAEERVTASYLVGADGRNSAVAQRLSALASDGRDSESRDARAGAGGDRVGVSWYTARQPALEDVVHMYLCENGYCGLVNVDDRHANVSMVTRADSAGLARRDFAEFLHKTLHTNTAAAARFKDLDPVGEIRSAFPIDPRRNRIEPPARYLPATLVGDARQTVEPFTGEGVVFAFEDGMAAADRLIDRAVTTHIAAGGRFRVNRIFSPVLRTSTLRENLIAVGAAVPALSRWVARTVFCAAAHKARANPK